MQRISLNPRTQPPSLQQNTEKEVTDRSTTGGGVVHPAFDLNGNIAPVEEANGINFFAEVPTTTPLDLPPWTQFTGPSHPPVFCLLV